MFRNSLASLILLVAVSVFSTSSSFGQCGNYFRSDYRVPGKVGRELNFGFYVLNDWTGDGRSDFWNFRLNQATQTADIVIYPSLNAGYWNWNTPIIYSTSLPSTVVTGDFAWIFTIKDFDSDGRIDMLVTNQGASPSRRIHRNSGDGTLQAQALIPNPTGSLQHIDHADLNSDGRLDWIYTLDDPDPNPMVLHYAPGNPDGSFGPAIPILAATAENQLTTSYRIVADFTGDGKPDIAYSNWGGTLHVRLIKNLGNGQFSLGNGLAVPTEFDAAGDFQNDGRADLYSQQGNSVIVLSGSSDGTFSSAVYTATNPSSVVRRSADFNGDGRQDLITIGHQDYEIFISNPTGGFTSRFYPNTLKYYRITGSELPPMVFEDFSGDGKADVFFGNHDHFNAWREEVVVIRKNFCDFKGQTRGMTFDSNPLPDIVTWNGADGQWRYGNGDFNAGGSTLLSSFHWGSGSHGDVPAPGDFDGDGRTDHTVYRPGEGNWYVYLSSNSSWLVFRFGLAGDIPIPHDYNGGGKTDFAVFRPSDGNWYIWYTETGQFTVVHFGANGDRPVPADFDGDGKTDITVFRPSEGNWYYVRSSDSGVGIVHWGTSGDIPLPADYDGDGKADLTVYRPGTWYILRSSNGAYSPVNWGTGADIPVPYLDRGEVWLPTVQRPSNSRWYSIRYPIGYSLPLSGPPVYFGLPNN